MNALPSNRLFVDIAFKCEEPAASQGMAYHQTAVVDSLPQYTRKAPLESLQTSKLDTWLNWLRLRLVL